MPTIRNEIDRTKLIERINKLTGDETPAWGKMTAEQMMSHLVQASDLPFESNMADHSTRMSRTIIKPLVLYVLPIPKEVKVAPEMDQQAQGRKPQGFDIDRRLLIDSLNKLAAMPADHQCLGHPFFGKMSVKEWAVLAHKHTNHHLKQFGV